VFYGILALTLSVILIGPLGVIAARTKNACLVGGYGLFTMIGFVCFLSTGAVMVATDVTAGKQIDNYCSGNTN
jgi:hypothetical protein